MFPINLSAISNRLKSILYLSFLPIFLTLQKSAYQI